MSISHAFSSGKSDGADSTLVQPSNWNAPHVIDNATITYAMLQNISATKRLIGRNTAGAGVPEEVTASQLFDWVSSSNGALLTRTSGIWAAVANITTDSGDLVAAVNASPASPSAGAKLFAASSGGRAMLSGLAPAGGKMILQPLIGQRRVHYWAPSAGGTTFTQQGSVLSATGTATSRNPASTSMFTTAGRVGYVSAAGAGSAAGARENTAQRLRGNGAGIGGFHAIWRFGISDAVLVSTANMFCGLIVATSAPTDVAPSTLVNMVGVGCDNGDTQLQLYSSGAVAQTRTALGSSFPVNTVNTDLYELALYAPPNGSTITWQVTRLNTGDTTSGTISAGASLMSTTSMLCSHIYRSNGGTASAVGVDLCSFYSECDV